MLKIGMILASSRQGRNGELIAEWLTGQFKSRPDVQLKLIDLREWALPAYEHETGPRIAELAFKDHSLEKNWYQLIRNLDAFIILTPEYNHGYPGSLKNALDCIYTPWNYKPVAFVSYGFSASGARAIEQLRLVSIELRMIPIRDELNISLNFSFDGSLAKRAITMIDELLWMAEIMNSARREPQLKSLVS